jgi:hypothetical protein
LATSMTLEIPSSQPISSTSLQRINPGYSIQIKGKILNLFGIISAIITFTLAIFFLPLIGLGTIISLITKNGKVSF